MRFLRDFLLLSQPPSMDLPFPAHEIALFHQVTCQNASLSVDQQTWRDLELDCYLDQLSPELSIFGQQSLHQRLSAGASEQEAAATGSRIQALLQDKTLLGELHDSCRPLRETVTEISAALFRDQVPPAPRWLPLLPWLPLFTSVALLLSFISLYALIAVAIGGAVLIGLQLRMHRELEAWSDIRAALRKLLGVSSALAALAERGSQQSQQLLHAFCDTHARAITVNRRLTPSPYLYAMPLISAYADWLCLANIRHYFRALANFQLHRDFLQQCFIKVGQLEADIALARHLAGQPQFCWARRHTENRLALDEVVHPLLKRATPMSVEIRDKGIFLSGQNGIGKSTLLRAIGINLLTARAFGFCYARQAHAPALNVRTSILVEDSLAAGESLYMAELRRARELLEFAQSAKPGIIIIDEIFRGTNHLEGISAAAAVLHTLAGQSLLVVSSHNLVLAPLLAGRLLPYRIERRDPQQGSPAGLSLAPGILAETNGIAMLSAGDFGEDIRRKAGQVHSWLSSSLVDMVTVPALTEP